MLSPQVYDSSPIYPSEDEGQEALGFLNTKEVMKQLKKFSYLGSLQSKINFLYTCLLFSITPKGFQIKWSEQTGLSSQELSNSIGTLLQNTSIGLQKSVLSASYKAFKNTLIDVMDLKKVFPENDWFKGMQNYQFIFNMCSAKHQKKIFNISPSTKLQLF